MAQYEVQPQPGYPGYGQPAAGYGQPAAGYGQPAAGYAAHHTTVVLNQPGRGMAGAPQRMWSTGVCDICADMTVCLCGTVCALCLACQVSTDMGESPCVPCCVPGADIVLRTKWRTQENIQGSIMNDCLTAWCCGPCAMCQLAREVQGRKNGTL